MNSIPDKGSVSRLVEAYQKNINEAEQAKSKTDKTKPEVKSKIEEKSLDVMKKVGEELAEHSPLPHSKSDELTQPKEPEPTPLQGRGTSVTHTEESKEHKAEVLQAITTAGKAASGISENGLSNADVLIQPLHVEPKPEQVKLDLLHEKIESTHNELVDVKKELNDAKSRFTDGLNKKSFKEVHENLSNDLKTVDADLVRLNNKISKTGIFTRNKTKEGYVSEKTKLENKQKEIKTKLNTLTSTQLKVDMELPAIIFNLNKNLDKLLEKVVNTTNLNPPEDIHQQELFETPDGKGVMGRVETTSKTDKHQMHGPRNDDNVSITQLKGGGSIIIETDGAGGGGMGSAVLSHELNKNLNEGLTLNSSKLKNLCQELNQAPEEGKDTARKNLETAVKSITAEALTKAIDSTKSNKSLTIKEKSAAATTLSVVISIPLPDNRTINFGLQNHDSASVLWNPSTGDFEPTSFHTAGDDSQIAINAGFKGKSTRQSVENNMNTSQFFIDEFEGNRLAIAFSDGVLDNLPGANDQEKLNVLNDIVRNPVFDTPLDTDIHKPTLILTSNGIRSIGDPNVRSAPEEINPKVVRDRIMNFTVFASAGQRAKQGGSDIIEGMLMNPSNSPLVKNINMTFTEGQTIDNTLFNALPSNAKNNLTQVEGGYKFNKNVTVLTCAISKDKYSELGSTFNAMVPTITVSKENAPEGMSEKLENSYKDRKIKDDGSEVVFFFENTIYESIGIDYNKRILAEAKEIDPSAIAGKTDGVSVVVASVGFSNT